VSAGSPEAGIARADAARATIGIVVPCLGQGRFLAEALDSVLGQEGDVLVAVVDGGSTDGSLAVIRGRADRLAYWRSAPDRGQAAAINEGVGRLGRARYVGWLNADDVLRPGALARMAGHLDRHPECVAVYGRAHVVDAGGRVLGEFPTRPFRRARLARRSIICQPASLIRRSAWQQVGGLDDALHMCLDYDLWWKLSAVGPIGYLDEVLAASRDHEATKTRGRQDLLYEEAFRVVRRHWGRVPWRWCLSEAAYRWRASHGGRRASGPAAQFLCGTQAVVRYLAVNAPRQPAHPGGHDSREEKRNGAC
jgi:GT2 family glycosyltransferase